MIYKNRNKSVPKFCKINKSQITGNVFPTIKSATKPKPVLSSKIKYKIQRRIKQYEMF